MFNTRVDKLLNEALAEREDLFLIDRKISGANEIHVVIDGDKGVTLADCMFISRAVEHNLDREEHDFSLQVTSAGATTPLELPRQFIKNIGRQLEVEAVNGEKETGTLIDATPSGIELEWKAREPKLVGKGKHTVVKNWSPNYDEIKQARVVITFN